MKWAFFFLFGIALFAAWALAFFWSYVFATSYVFANGLVDSEWGWPLAGVAVLLCLLSYSFVLNRMFVRLDR